MLRALLFNFHGVLVNDGPVHLELTQRVLAEEGIEVAPDDDRQDLATILQASGREVAAMELSRLTARKAAYYHQYIREQGFPLSPGVAKLIEAAIDDGLMLGVVSRALRGEVEGVLEQLGVRDHFKSLVTADDLDEGQPVMEGYRRGLELLNALPPLPRRMLHPHEVLAIEDSPIGLNAAAANGLRTLGVAHATSTEALAVADHVVASLADVTLRRIRKKYG